ncbi:DUF6103 family protein [Tissierella praeacuta]|jgi:hypothetical protein|uniref:DUF6103 family protein n=1 Tax=Tissierella praeacuta TaxID=43131 RepID=UPI003DA637AA
MEKVTLQVTFPKEKLDALRFYMNEKQLTVEEELQKHIKNTYDKYVPSATRRYLDRNDNSEEIAAVTNENTSETVSRNTTTRGRRRAGRSQSAGEQETAETINEVEIEETSDQTEEQNQGMTMSM